MKKNGAKKTNELDEFSNELIDLLPTNKFQRVIKQIENFDGTIPETLLAKIKTISSSSTQISDEKQQILKDKFLKAVHSPQYASQIKSAYTESIKFLKNFLKKDSRYSLLINLINKADKNVELVSLPILSPFIYSEQYFILSCKPQKLLEQIDNSAGEKRKNFLVELLREIPEPLYKHYLEAIWRLSYLAESKMFPKETPSFGELVNQTANRLEDFSGLVDRKMTLLRNSFVHKNFDYFFKDDSFIVWDDNTPKMTMKTDEIIKIVKKATSMCIETFPLIAYLYLVRNFYLNSGFLDFQLEKIPTLVSANPIEVLKAESELIAFGELLTEPMRNFFLKHQ